MPIVAIARSLDSFEAPRFPVFSLIIPLLNQRLTHPEGDPAVLFKRYVVFLPVPDAIGCLRGSFHGSPLNHSIGKIYYLPFSCNNANRKIFH